MSKPFSILMLLRGEGLELGFSDGELVEAQESPSSGKVYSFGAGLMSLSVPERSISLSGKGSKSGSASASIPESEWDIIRSLKAGVVSAGVHCEFRYFEDGAYWVEAPILFSGFLSSAKLNAYDGTVDLSFGGAERIVNVQFPMKRVGDEGRFENPPEDTFDRILPVVYGTVLRYDIPAIGFDTSAGGGGTVDVCIAAHPVYGSIERPGYVQIGNSDLGNMSPWYEVKNGVDLLGGSYSYITVSMDDWDDGIYARNVSGKLSQDSRPMDGLGDIAQDMWSTYSSKSEGTFDYVRSSYATPILNRFTVGMAFTEAVKGQTLFDVMAGRLGSLPFAFGAPIGLVGWDASIIPNDDTQESGHLSFGVNVFERSDINIAGYDKIQNRFKASFQYDGVSEGNSLSFVIDETNSALCRTSQSMYGQSEYVELSAPDVITPSSVSAYISCEINKRAVPRMTVSYFCDDSSYLSAPLLSVYKVTDTEVGLDGALFFLEAVRPDIDNGGCLLTLRSVKSTESTLKGVTNASNS